MFFKKKKTILLDIDGVIAPTGVIDEDFKIISLNGWSHIGIPFPTIDFINELFKRKDVEVIWGSSWGEHSLCINKELGLPNSKYLTFYNHYDEEFKSIEINDFLRENKRTNVLVVDDELKMEETNRLKIISPNSKKGLTSMDMNDIIEWIDSK